MIRAAHPDELTACQRAAIVAANLARGVRLTQADVVSLTGLGYRRTYGLLSDLSGVLPIGQNDNHKWQWIDKMSSCDT